MVLLKKPFHRRQALKVEKISSICSSPSLLHLPVQHEFSAVAPAAMPGTCGLCYT